MGLTTNTGPVQAKPQPGRVVTMFGIPFSGKTFLVDVLCQSVVHHNVGVIKTGDIARSLMTPADREAMKNGGLFPREQEMRDQILSKVEHWRRVGADVIFIDGAPRFADQVQWMYDNHLIGARSGRIVHVRADVRNIQARIAKRARSDDDVASHEDRIKYQKAQIPSIDELIRKLGMFNDYFTIFNAEGQQLFAAAELARVAQIKEAR